MTFNLCSNRNPASLFKIAFYLFQAAEHGSQSTSTMAARAGRSSYVNVERLNCVDPGALAVATWLRAACDALEE